MVSSIAISVLNEEQILADILAIAQDKGVINEVFEQSRIYIYYSVFARVLGNLSRIYSEYLQSVDIYETRDEALLEQLLKPFIEKKMATVSKTILRFRRRVQDEYDPEDILIEAGTRVSTDEENPVMFRTAEAKILRKTAYEVLVPAYSIEVGSKNNVRKDTLTYFVSELFAEIEVTNIIDAYGGQDEETAFDARNRISSFRYTRDGSESYVSKLIQEYGVGYANFSLSQYYDGSGSFLIALDIESIEEYYDIIKQIQLRLFSGLSGHFCMVERIYLNLDIDISITGIAMYDSYDVADIVQTIKQGVAEYFGLNVYVGFRLSIKRLESFLLQYLVSQNFEIYETEISVGEDSSLIFDNETDEVVVEPYQKLYVNKLETNIFYNRV